MQIVSLNDLLTPAPDPTPIMPHVEYKTAGILSHGKGLFARPVRRGRDISYSTYYRLHTDQLVYSRLFAWEGALAIVPNEFDGFFVSQEFPTFDIDSTKALPSYMALLINRAGLWDRLAEVVSGMGGRRKRVHPAALLATSVPVPSLADQRRIVDLVSSIDVALTECERQVAAVHALRTSLLAELISIPVQARQWPTIELGEMATLSLGFTKGQRVGSLVDVPYLRAANLYFSELRLHDVSRIAVLPAEAEKHRLETGDLLLTEGGNSWDLGRGWIWEGQIAGCIHQNSIIRASGFPADVNPRFVAHALETRELRQYFESRAAQTSGMAHLGKGGASLAPIPKPPPAVQDRIVTVLDAALSTAQAARTMSSRLSRLRQEVVRDLVTGARSLPASYDRLLGDAA